MWVVIRKLLEIHIPIIKLNRSNQNDKIIYNNKSHWTLSQFLYSFSLLNHISVIGHVEKLDELMKPQPLVYS